MMMFMVMLNAAASAVAEDKLTLSTGFDYSSGKYGTTTSTDILYIPFTAKYKVSENLTTKLTASYIRMTSNGNIIPGVGVVAGTSNVRTTQSGIGDTVAAADYTLYAVNRFLVDAVGKIKFGTADANKGLGTGKNDYSGQLDVYRLVGRDTTLFATAGYKVVGTPAASITPYSNEYFGTLGVNQRLSKDNSAGVMFDFSQSPVITSEPMRDLTFYASHRLSSWLKLQADLRKGLSYGSADYGGGMALLGSF
ncbi:MAG TPA: hypothetical protein PLK99_06580 [Burkholderiales bacterium]|nr:hypothetical protein [Burkholderiales bacterium]